MATFRQVHCLFWTDPTVQNLSTEEKLFFVYLLTNSHSKQCGISQITKRTMAFETGISESGIDTLLIRFQELDKIKFSNETSELAIKNWRKYNPGNSPKIKACIDKELEYVKDRVLIEYIYGIDTQSQRERNKEKDKEREKGVLSLFIYDSLVEKLSAYMDSSDYTGKITDPRKLANKFLEYLKDKYNGELAKLTETQILSKAIQYASNER